MATQPYHIAKDGEWIRPHMRGFIMLCCKCGLAHRMNFRIVKGCNGKQCVEFQAFRCKRTGKKILDKK